MYIQEFSKRDIILNRIKTNPRFEFRISKEGNFSLKNGPISSQIFLGNEIGFNDIVLSFPYVCRKNALDFYCLDNSYNLSLI